MFVCFVPKVLRGEACPHLRVDNDPQLRVSAPARGTSANIQIHRDSGNCLIGLGALLRRIKQSQGMSPSWGGSEHSCPRAGLSRRSKTSHCPRASQSSNQASPDHCDRFSAQFTVFWNSAKLHILFVALAFSQQCHHVRLDGSRLSNFCQIAPFTQLWCRRRWTSH